MNAKDLIEKLQDHVISAEGNGNDLVVCYDEDGYVHDTICVEWDKDEGQVVIKIEAC